MLKAMSHLKIHLLSQGGMTQVAIAHEIGCSIRTVYSVLRGPPPTPEEIASGAMRRARPPGRPSLVASLKAMIEPWLVEKPDLRVTEVLRRARSAGYRGGDRSVYRLVDRIRPAAHPPSPEVRFDGLPGEFAQFDFGQCRVTYRDGTVEKVRFFEGVLKYSRYRHVVIVDNEKAETLARATVSCFTVWGGAPKQWVYDNPTTVWCDRAKQVAHPYLRQLLAECNALIEATVPRRPNQKGSVENGIGYAKHGFFLGRSFTDRAEMERELLVWLRYVNEERPHSSTGDIPAVRLLHEQERLRERAIRHTGASFPLIETATVLPTALVRWEGAAYSVDPKRLGAPATLLIRKTTIDIEINGVRCTHPRMDFSGAVSRLPEHSLAQVAITTEKRKKTYAMRQHLFDMGPVAMSFCDQLIMGWSGNGWYRDIQRLYDIAMEVGRERFLTALTVCLERKECQVHAVTSVLASQGVAS